MQIHKKYKKVNNNFKSFKDLYILSLKTFIYSPLNMFLGVFLVIFTLFIWLLFKGNNPFLFSSAIGALIVRNGIHTFHRALSNNKNSGFDKRINSTGLNSFIKPGANILANFTINFCIIVLLMCLTLLFFKEQRALFSSVNWTMFLGGTISLWLLCVLISYAIFMFVESTVVGSIYVSLIYIFSYNLLGCAFPYEVVARINWLNFILYFLPQRYMLNVMQAGWVNAKNLVYEGLGEEQLYKVDFRLGENLAIPFIITYSLILILSFCLITFIIFKVKQKKVDVYGTSIVLKLSTDYIRDIKKCSNIVELKQLRENHMDELKNNSKYIKKISLIKTKKKR
ncbi:ABC transporter permease protein [Spiroplasma cantharicola]|uniref:ABC transporter permease protein n=2 Tax=Spiroplasma cantharicola TaxID=362837 RepID=A0A0M4JST2_9MOLU|nr:ABC transporter permease protein [Spiroplasma cantharicola]